MFRFALLDMPRSVGVRSEARRKAERFRFAPPNGSEDMKTTGQPVFIGYSRVSTEEQADRRNGLEAQHAVISAEAERRGWQIDHVTDAGVSGKNIGPQLRKALDLLASGQADGLVVAKLDRLSRSIINASNILEAAQSQGWSLVVLDMSLDLTTAAGRMMANQFIVFAQYERELIGERTKSFQVARPVLRPLKPWGHRFILDPSAAHRTAWPQRCLRAVRAAVHVGEVVGQPEREPGRYGHSAAAGTGLQCAGDPLMLEDIIAPAAEAAGLPKGVRLHDFRHTFTALQLTHGVHYLQVSRWLGHASPQVTMAIYADWIPDEAIPNTLPEPMAAAPKPNVVNLFG